MSMLVLGFLVLVFTAVFLIILAIAIFWRDRYGRFARKYDQRLRQMAIVENASSKHNSILKDSSLSDSPFVSYLLGKLPGIRFLHGFLQESGLKWPVARLVFYSGAGCLLGLAIGLALQLAPLATLVLSLGPLLFPAFLVRRQRTKRVRQLELQLPDATDFISRALRAGHSLTSAIDMVGVDTPDPLGSEFRIMFAEISYGVSLNDALLGMMRRVPIEDMRYVVTGILIHREVGGNLAELLSEVGHVVRERIKLLDKVRVLAAEGVLSARVLTLLPFAIVGVLSLVNSAYIRVLWTDPTGIKLSIVSSVLMVTGILWMRNLVKIRV